MEEKSSNQIPIQRDLATSNQIPIQRNFSAQGARPKQPSNIKLNLTYNKAPKDRVVSNESDFPGLGSSIKQSPTHHPKEPNTEVTTNQRETGPFFIFNRCTLLKGLAILTMVNISEH